MMKVVIIDDEKLIRQGLADYIDWASMDMTVVGTAGDGVSGMNLILDTSPDIVISDIRLPLMTGTELLKKLHEEQIGCKVILISAYGDFSYAQEAVRYGAFDYILKPIEEDVLTQSILRCRDHILQQTADQPLAEVPVDSIPVTDVESYRERLVAQAVAFVRENCSREIYLEQVSAQVNMSASHFSRVFKEITGDSFSQYIYRLRMEKAKELICGSPYKIYEISEMVGYTDISHFSKKFKDFWGHSPAHYRKE